MRKTRDAILLSVGCAVLLVAGLSLLSFVPMLRFCSYPLVPGIALSGTLFSTVAPGHMLRMTIGALLVNAVLYTGLFFILFGGGRKAASR